ncbi:MAG: M20/M25/M40 family metallo-hydrolase [Tepidisphaeraceae bacterium]
MRISGPVAPGSPGMFDQGTARVRGKTFFCRVCDDLAGVAAALTMLDELRTRRPRATVAVLLTRAEEDGFIGAVAAAKSGTLVRKTDRIISVECSAMQPHAKQGDGVIIRVGDRISIFDSSFTFFMTRQAGELAKTDKSFRFQRALMPGGACEGTVFTAWGYTTAAACVALGNYHNMDRQKQRIGPEYVNVDDWKNMVKLFVRLAQTIHKFEPGYAAVRGRIERRFMGLSPLLMNHARS